MKLSSKLLLVGLAVVCAFAVIPDRHQGMMAQSKNEVVITNSKYEPKKLTITEGTTVTWNNKEGSHTVTADDNAFSSKVLKANDTFTYEFTKPGTYPYHCTFHGGKGGVNMAGTIVVVKKK